MIAIVCDNEQLVVISRSVYSTLLVIDDSQPTQNMTLLATELWRLSVIIMTLVGGKQNYQIICNFTHKRSQVCSGQLTWQLSIAQLSPTSSNTCTNGFQQPPFPTAGC